jgi:hypothetical protein
MGDLYAGAGGAPAGQTSRVLQNRRARGLALRYRIPTPLWLQPRLRLLQSKTILPHALRATTSPVKRIQFLVRLLKFRFRRLRSLPRQPRRGNFPRQNLH